jgi:DNA invertase Pin-like site-specific DNA recombinase
MSAKRTAVAVSKPSSSLTPRRVVVGYRRVSTTEQRNSGAGLEAQRQAIVAECERRGWALLEVFEDGAASGKSLAGRPGLQAALDAVESKRASAIVAMKLDRLSRSLLDFANLMERSRRKGWAIVALDLAVDTTSPSGEVMASVLSAFAAYERRLIGQRTKDALAIKKQQGVRIGRPRSVTDETARRIRRLRSHGLSLRAVAARLDADGHRTGHGAEKWSAESVRGVLTRR